MTSRKNSAILIVMSDNWSDEVTARIAGEIRRLRGDRSGQWLSDRTADLGNRVSRSTISEIETGRRKSITVTDLILLACALRVPPVQLLYPNMPDGKVEIVPGEKDSSIVAAQWFSGEVVREPESLSSPQVDSKDAAYLRDIEQAAEVYEGARLVGLARERINLQSQIRSRSKTIARLRSSSDDPALTRWMDEDIPRMEKRIEAIDAELRQIEGAVVDDGR
jgi:transcriptional regulator with XRE-family HTH domain